MAALVASGAYAQRVHVPLSPVLRPGLITLPHLGATSHARLIGLGTLTSAPDTPLTPLAGLSAFHIGYQGGDHMFRRSQLLLEGALVRAAFTDRNDDDYWAIDATWINFTGGQSGSVSGRGGGRQPLHLAIPAGPPNSTFVLRGFSFERDPGTDANLKQMAIGLEPSGDSIEVMLSDNEGADFRLGQRGARNLGRDGRQYDVTVQYAWIPNSLVASSGIVTGSVGNREAASIPAGAALISGFSFQFLNGDHHIWKIDVDTANGGMGQFQDNNTDDPMHWQINYVSLKPPA